MEGWRHSHEDLRSSNKGLSEAGWRRVGGGFLFFIWKILFMVAKHFSLLKFSLLGMSGKMKHCCCVFYLISL